MLKTISNTSCMIILDNIGMIDILKDLYGTIVITKEVSEEFGKAIPSWIEVTEVNDYKYLKLLSHFLDLGEASTITLALEAYESLTIIDDLKARKIAQKLNIKITGTIGVIIKARKENVISSTKDVLIKLRKEGFRISKELERELLKHDNWIIFELLDSIGFFRFF